MFGVALADLSSVGEDEKARYEQLYCGLCLSLKQRYGQIGRACVSYDLVFLAMLLNSLHEDAETSAELHCPTHMGKKKPYIKNSWSDYAADLSIALAYNKFLDDANDEGGLKAKAGEVALKKAYAKACEYRPYACDLVAKSVLETTKLESTQPQNVEEIANVTGKLMAYLFATGAGSAQDAGVRPLPLNPDEAPYFSDSLYVFGTSLGRFIYFMDAAIDYDEDMKNSSYNAFSHLSFAPCEARDALAATLEPATQAFERMPLLRDENLMSAVLYAGVWQKYNKLYLKNYDEGESGEILASPSANL
jgi:hypothetical protein